MKKKRKAEFIPNHRKLTCWCCDGEGCNACKGTGLWIEEHYILVTKDKNGNKIAFGVDGLR